MRPFNLTPAPSTPVPFVSACRLWRRGLKWWLLIGIVMQALLILAICVPGEPEGVSSQDSLRLCLASPADRGGTGAGVDDGGPGNGRWPPIPASPEAGWDGGGAWIVP